MNGRRAVRIAGSAFIAALAIGFGRPWVALAIHAASYPVTGSGETANVVIDGETVFASRAERGIDVIDAVSGKVVRTLAPPLGSESVDDLAIANGLLFALDARTPGHLSVFSLDDLSLASPPVDVAVGPFSGVSAGGGRVLVSGGTSQMSLRSYDSSGQLSPVLATIDLGRGQPDVLLAPDGTRAFVSTHDWGPYFGVTTVRVDAASLTRASVLPLDTYGFTNGGAKPVSFPLETALANDVLLIADLDGLTIVSTETARPLAQLNVGVEAVNVDASNGLAAVVGSSPRPLLVLVNITSPAHPRVVRSIPLRGQPTGVAIGATHIAVATQQHGVLLINHQP
ncbi:MAG: hypothetical protein ACLGH0_06665 [Thermoanaerobaculia bacterium]